MEEGEEIRVEEYKEDESVKKDKMKEISSEVEEDKKIIEKIQSRRSMKSKKTHKIDESKIVKTDGDVQTKVSERVIATTKK